MESALVSTSPVVGVPSPVGIVSPSAMNVVTESSGVSAMSWSPKMPLGSTAAVVRSGTWYSFWIDSVTSSVPSGMSLTRCTKPMFTPASSTGCPFLRPAPHGKRAYIG